MANTPQTSEKPKTSTDTYGKIGNQSIQVLSDNSSNMVKIGGGENADEGTRRSFNSRDDGLDNHSFLADSAGKDEEGDLTKASTSNSFALMSAKLLTPTTTFHSENEFYVDSLRAKFTELSKPNLFKVTFKLNSGLKLPNDLELVQYLLKSVSLPPMNVSKLTVPYHGVTYHFPGDITFEDFVNFLE